MNGNQEIGVFHPSRDLARLVGLADALAHQQQVTALASSFFGGGSNRPPISPTSTAMMVSSVKRSLQNNGNVQEPRIKKHRFEEKGVNDDVKFREYQAEIWTEKFEDLCEFKKNHGHCHVPHTYTANPALAQWVKRQRYQYKLKVEGKRSTLTDDRVKLLNQIGFIWSSHDAVWEERLDDLLMYKQIHQDCVVPSNYPPNPQLAVWVKRQRRQYKFYCEGKPTSMTPERISSLEKLGFAWDCRKSKGGDESSHSSNRNPPSVGTNGAETTPRAHNFFPVQPVHPLMLRAHPFPAELLSRNHALAAAQVSQLSLLNPHQVRDFLSFRQF